MSKKNKKAKAALQPVNTGEAAPEVNTTQPEATPEPEAIDDNSYVLEQDDPQAQKFFPPAEPLTVDVYATPDAPEPCATIELPTSVDVCENTLALAEADEPPLHAGVEHNIELAVKAVEAAHTALLVAKGKLRALLNDGELSPADKAWQTRIANGYVPQAKAATTIGLDPNDPNLTAGQKAAITRRLKKADPTYVSPASKPKPNTKASLEAALNKAFADLTSFDAGTRVDLTVSA